MTTNDVANVILASPGMGENVKIDLRTTRRNILLLSGVILKGLNRKDEGGSALLLDDIPKEVAEELIQLANEFISKSGLSELSEALRALGSKK